MCSAAPVAALQAAREVAQGTASVTRSLPAVTTAAPRHGQGKPQLPQCLSQQRETKARFFLRCPATKWQGDNRICACSHVCI